MKIQPPADVAEPEESYSEAVTRSNAIERALAEDPSVHRVLTGDRPTGPLHVGHEFGSIKNRVRLQNMGVETFIVIADYQVLTDRDETESINVYVRDLVLDYLSLGLDPWSKRTFIFPHSHVPELHQLVVPFSMLTTIGELQRNPTTKDEISAGRLRHPSLGMLMYPVSQAADILFCKATVVPVGRDQLPHIELTRKIARRCNSRYGKARSIFPEPVALLSDVPLLLGLDGYQKMSKSRSNAIFLSMTADQIRSAIKSARTDALSTVTFEPMARPEISNLVLLYSLCSGLATSAVIERFVGRGYGDFKNELADVVNAHIEPIRQRRVAFEYDRGLVNEVLSLGIAAARTRAAGTLDEIRTAMNMNLSQ